MAEKGRISLKNDNNTQFPTNNNKEITAERFRNYHVDDIDSSYNIVDDDAEVVNYPPKTSSDWDVSIPDKAGSALDQLAKRMRSLELNNSSNSVAYVSKQGSDTIGEFELGNPKKPFLTIQAAADALTTNNGVLIVLGGGTYNEDVTLKLNSVNCVFDFNQCTITGTFTNIASVGNNGCIVKNVNINDTSGSTSDVRSEFMENVNYTGTGAFGVYSKYCLNSSFVSSSSIVTVSTLNITEVHYLISCGIQNTGTGEGIRNSPNTVLLTCVIQTGTGIAISPNAPATTIQEVMRLYNCEVKSSGVCVFGDQGVTNLLAYNTKFYSSNSNVIQQGSNLLFGTYLNFEGCEFYTKGDLNVFAMLGTGGINRTAQENYTFKNCLFHTVTGFPVEEPPSYNAGDLGTTLLVNCVYTAATATSPAAVKVTEHNSFSFPNYTDFNNLQ